MAGEGGLSKAASREEARRLARYWGKEKGRELGTAANRSGTEKTECSRYASAKAQRIDQKKEKRRENLGQ